jgi:hypothetical protein
MGGHTPPEFHPDGLVPPDVLIRTCEPVVENAASASLHWRLGAFDEDVVLFGASPRSQAGELHSLLENAPGEAEAWRKSGVENPFIKLDPYAVVAQRALVTASRNVACTNTLVGELRRSFSGPLQERMSEYFVPALGTYAMHGIWAARDNEPQAVTRLTAFGYSVLPEEDFVYDTTLAINTALQLGKPWSAMSSALRNLILVLPEDSRASEELQALYNRRGLGTSGARP